MKSKKPPHKSKVFTLRFSEEYLSIVQKAAETVGQNVGQYIREAVNEKLGKDGFEVSAVLWKDRREK